MLFEITRSSSDRRSWHRGGYRTGSAALIMIVVLALIAAVGGFFAWKYYSNGDDSSIVQPTLATATRGSYENLVVEKGEVESSNNVEVKCEVKAKGGAGTSILWVIEAASMVEKGDLLVELDGSAIEDEMNQQRIVCNSSLALKIQAENVFEAATIAKVEYLEGAYEQERQTIQSEIFIAEENLRRAKQYAQYSERLAAKGYVTALQLEGDRFAVEKAQNELDLAKQKLHVLEEYTRAKTLKTLESDIAIARAKAEAETESYQLEMQKLDDLKTQIAKCEIRSPAAGQVVHANEYSARGGSSEFVVEPGASVREGQTIIRIPDPSSMQVKATVNEAKITSVEVGMPVAIRIDALGDQFLQGEVMQVNEYAEPTSWFMSNVKKYGTLIRIKDPPHTLRPGLTAQVRIFVERRSDALQIPVQAVYSSGKKTFVLAKNGDQYETREIEIDSSNDKTVTIVSGLEEGDQVARNPRSHVELFDLPEVATGTQLASLNDYDTGERRAPDGAAAEPGRGEFNRAPPADRRAGAPGGAGPPGGFPQRGPPGGGPPGGGPGGGFNPTAIVNSRFATLDTNGDGQISAEEMPAEEKDRLAQADADGDGSVSKNEMIEALKAVQARMQAGGGGGAQ